MEISFSILYIFVQVFVGKELKLMYKLDSRQS